MQTENERAIAVRVLIDVLEKKAFANISLRDALSGTAAPPYARAFITELVNETLRNLLLIDHVINEFSKIPVDKMKPFIRNLLRVSVCQLRHIDKVPASAAVNEAVNLAKAYNFANLAGFVNGVLRNIARKPSDLPVPNTAEGLALRYSYPKWLIADLVRWLGEENAREFCRNSHRPPPVTVLTNTNKTSVADLVEKLNSAGVKTEAIENSFLILRNTGDLSKLEAFKEGLFFVIDPGAMRAVTELAPKPGQLIIDLCAAPGGKSFAAACLMKNKGRILSYDIYPHRVELIDKTSRRLGLSIIEASVRDALAACPELEGKADGVLLDAPCSGFGTIRKHPEIKCTRTRDALPALAEKQLKMLSAAAKYVKPGGVLVYCTCTVSKEENIDNVEVFLETHPGFALENSCQTLPSEASDGFFTARFVKTSKKNL